MGQPAWQNAWSPKGIDLFRHRLKKLAAMLFAMRGLQQVILWPESGEDELEKRCEELLGALCAEKCLRGPAEKHSRHGVGRPSGTAKLEPPKIDLLCLS